MASDQGDPTLPHFYINNATWNCHYQNARLSTDTYNVHRGVCAYIPTVTDSVYLCQGPDPACWTYNHLCTGGDEITPGAEQIRCSARDVSWCCLKDWETCTGFENQSNVCWAKTFPNPLVGVDLWSDEATISAGVVLERQGLRLETVPPLLTPSITAVVAAPTTTTDIGSDLPANISAILDAEHAKIVNEAHAKAVIVVTVIGSLIALGLFLNAALWLMRIRHRNKAKTGITEVSGRDNTDSRRDLAAPSPIIAMKRDSTSSRMSLRERRHSSARTPSFASDYLVEIARGALGPHDESLRPPHRDRDTMTTSASATVVNSPTSETHTLTATGPNSHRFVSVSPSEDSPTLPYRKLVFTARDVKHFGNIAEAYDDVPEDPADLGGYAQYERCKRETERARMAKQPMWYEERLEKA